jgi:hypothetical protein
MREPFCECFWAMERKHRAAASIGVNKIGEARFDASALVTERERLAGWF